MQEHGAALRLPRMRSLTEAYSCIKEADPETAITANYVRCLIVSGAIPRMKCGKKYLVDDIRRRFGHYAIYRAVVEFDPTLKHINPKEDHTIHPIGYFKAM